MNCVSQSEREEFENEFKQQYEREKVLLTEENKKLTSELDKVSDQISVILVEHVLDVQHCDRNHGYTLYLVYIFCLIFLLVYQDCFLEQAISHTNPYRSVLERGFRLSLLILCPIYFFEPLFFISLPIYSPFYSLSHIHHLIRSWLS